jgi:hypothetical protein
MREKQLRAGTQHVACLGATARVGAPARLQGPTASFRAPHPAHRIVPCSTRRTVPYRAAGVFECDGVGSVRGAGWVMMIEMYTYRRG